jgi:hypothetical protein
VDSDRESEWENERERRERRGSSHQESIKSSATDVTSANGAQSYLPSQSALHLPFLSFVVFGAMRAKGMPGLS